ncbi:MAG: glycosyltransferase family 4 protein [Acidobacteriota bacterium]
MRIAYITAGAAGMYCGSCLHDNTLAAALQRMGHDVALIPTYTPIRTDETDVSIGRVFYGALNVYLEQKLALFRHAPAAVHWLFDRPALLNWVSGHGVSVDPHDLGELTLSVLQGEKGRQRRELEELIGWLKSSFSPDLVHITNSMFLGLGGPIKRDLGVPVVCSVQGEDIFLEDLIEPYKNQVHQLLCAHANDVDGIIATSRFYADFMAEYLHIAQKNIRVVRLGIKLEGHGEGPEKPAGRPFVVGYLARVCPPKGLHLLVEAFRDLANRVGREEVELRVAGYVSKGDRRYLDGIRDRVVAWGLGDSFEYIGEVNRAEKIEFLQGLDALSVPTTYKEPKGLFVLEALANGVPVVEPRHGAFPELIEATGGGLLVEPDSPSSLAAALATLRENPALRSQLGQQGRRVVEKLYSDSVMAEATLKIYREWTYNGS